MLEGGLKPLFANQAQEEGGTQPTFWTVPCTKHVLYVKDVQVFGTLALTFLKEWYNVADEDEDTLQEHVSIMENFVLGNDVRSTNFTYEMAKEFLLNIHHRVPDTTIYVTNYTEFLQIPIYKAQRWEFERRFHKELLGAGFDLQYSLPELFDWLRDQKWKVKPARSESHLEPGTGYSPLEPDDATTSSEMYYNLADVSTLTKIPANEIKKQFLPSFKKPPTGPGLKAHLARIIKLLNEMKESDVRAQMSARQSDLRSKVLVILAVVTLVRVPAKVLSACGVGAYALSLIDRLEELGVHVLAQSHGEGGIGLR